MRANSLMGLLVYATISMIGVSTMRASTAKDSKPVESHLSGLASVSGTVGGPKPFQAARVYFRNADKRMLYMVYTSGGRYQATHLFPGEYKVNVKAKDLESEVRTVVLKAGKNGPVDLSLRPAAADSGDALPVSFAEMYPAGPGYQTARDTCIGCHGATFLPTKQFNSSEWNSEVTMMQGFGFVPQYSASDRADLIGWLTKNFGPDSKRRVLKFETEMPVDEKKLNKAMYIEYYLKPDPGKPLRGPGRRFIQEVHFDPDGNVWMTDRGIPNRLCRLDPRTGEIKENMMPTVGDSLHGVTVDSSGIVWTAELTPAAGHESHLNGFDPKTGTFQRYVMDPDHTLGPTVGVNSVSIDSKGNIWFTFSTKGQGLGEFDPNTKKISLHKIPTEKGMPYGIDFDREDNPWIAEFAAGKVAKFDVKAEKWTEYAPPSQPAKIRRLGLDPSGIVWFGIYNRGLIGRLDPETGKITEIKVPTEFSLPYEAWSDYKDGIWTGDGGMGGAMIHYDPKSGSFTYYPTPQITDAPKVEITRDGALWYSPRSADEVGGGVLYPDMTKITTLAAYYRGSSPVTSRYGSKTSPRK